jgi:SARP family transcriptional regulator, regulator of embCAB operon
MMRVNLFGAVTVDVDGHCVARGEFGGVKPKQVFEILVLERGGPIAKDRLADMLWADGLPRDHVATLATYVSVLRHRLQPAVGVRDSVIRTESGAYSIDTDQIDLDLDEFDALVGNAARSSVPVARTMLLDATDLARGEVLADERYVEWALPIRNVYRRRLVDALNRAAELSIALDDPLPAFELCERAILIDHANEESYQLIIAAAGALGRRSLAASTFARCEAALQSELGVRPLEATRQLLASVLNDDQLAAQRLSSSLRARMLATSMPFVATAS